MSVWGRQTPPWSEWWETHPLRVGSNRVYRGLGREGEEAVTEEAPSSCQLLPEAQDAQEPPALPNDVAFGCCVRPLLYLAKPRTAF